MKKYLLLILACALISGCGGKYYDHDSYPESQKPQLFARDSNQCEKYSRGLAPMPEGYKVKTPTTTYGTGSTVVDGQRYNYRYTATTTPNAYVEAGNAMQGVGSQMAALATQQRAYEMCMNSLGWFEVEKEAEAKGPSIYECLAQETEKAAQFLDDFEYVKSTAEKICEQKTGQKARNNIADGYADQALAKYEKFDKHDDPVHKCLYEEADSAVEHAMMQSIYDQGRIAKGLEDFCLEKTGNKIDGAAQGYVDRAMRRYWGNKNNSSK